jgi:hypothetical protein
LQQWDICPFLKGFLFTFFLFILPIFLHFDNGTNYTDNTVMYTVKFFPPFCTLFRIRILGRNPDKSLRSFLPCYSQSPPQLCFEMYSSSNPHNLLQFLQLSTLWRRMENSQDNVQKPQRNVTFMNFFSGRFAISYCTNECLLLAVLMYICFPMKQILGALFR